MAVSPYGQIMKAPATLAETVVYTADGTFEKADYPGLKYVRVRAVGGGGGGGGVGSTTSTQTAIASGGGAGATAESVLYDAQLAASETVTIGGGGAGGGAGGAHGSTHGSKGSASSFGTHVTAGAGSGGFGAGGGTDQALAGAVGGLLSESNGQSVSAGGPGQPGFGNGARAMSGAGGNSTLGGGGRPWTAAGGSSGGEDGKAHGGGGSGAVNGNGQSGQAGGNGAPGVVIVDVYVQEQGLIGDTGFVHAKQFPRGLLGLGEATSNQTFDNMSSETAIVSTTVTVPVDRRVKVTASTYPSAQGGDGGRARLMIYEGGTKIKQQDTELYLSGLAIGLEATVVRIPAPGTHVYKATLMIATGTITGTNVAASAYPTQIMVEDVGPA